MDGQREISTDARETEIRELIRIAGVSEEYATFCIESGFTAERVRHDLYQAVANDSRHPLAGVMKEQVRRGL